MIKKLMTLLFTTFLILLSLVVFGEPTEVSAKKTQYLTFTAKEDNSWVNINGDCGTLEYSTDGKNWTDYTLNTKINLAEIGDYVQFRIKSGGEKYKATYMHNNVTMVGKIAASGEVTTLLDENGGDVKLEKNQFADMFLNCTSLISAPTLPSTGLEEYCYYQMFKGCTSLETAPALPATNLKTYCYKEMFSGCTSLKTVPDLSATTLEQQCCALMFSGCTSLETAPALPATTLAMNCYSEMFKGCTSLKTAPALPATTLATRCYNEMFSGCTSLETAPVLPATILKGVYCYQSMFSGCTSLKTAPALPATTLVDNCYNSMFSGCTSLETAPALNATTLGAKCYNAMFKDCTSLKTAPELPAETLKANCYNSMFSGCTSLETAPALNATTLASSCYKEMFSGCTSLKTAPALNATTLASSCYESMFSGCTSLETAPALNAITLKASCYQSMFSGCTSLKAAPALNAMTLASSCYQSMFSGCTALTTVPKLPAETLVSNCYKLMFDGCTNIKLSETQTEEYQMEFRIPTSGTATGDGNCTNMFKNTGGTFTGTPSINKTYYLPGAKKEVTVIANDDYKVCGRKEPTLTAKVIGLIGTDTIEYEIVRAEGEEVGSYTITVSGKEEQGDYKITFVNGTFTIKPSRADDPKVDVDALNEIKVKYQNENPGAEITVKLEQSEDSINGDDKEKLEQFAEDKSLDLLNIILDVKINGNPVLDAGNVNDILIKEVFEFDFEAKTDVQVLRVHNGGAVEELTETPNGAGEYVEYDKTAGTITVVAKKYSTYAFCYTSQWKLFKEGLIDRFNNVEKDYDNILANAKIEIADFDYDEELTFEENKEKLVELEKETLRKLNKARIEASKEKSSELKKEVDNLPSEGTGSWLVKVMRLIGKRTNRTISGIFAFFKRAYAFIF